MRTIKNPTASSGVFEVARALRARNHRTEGDGYQLHAASGGEFTRMRLTEGNEGKLATKKRKELKGGRPGGTGGFDRINKIYGIGEASTEFPNFPN